MKGHIVKRSENSWSLVFDLGRDASGKRRQKWVTVKGTKRDAEKELTRILHEAQTDAFVEPARMNVAEYLEYWLVNYAKTNVVAKTYEWYEEIIRLYLIPGLGQHNLSKLQVVHIQSYYTRMLSEGRRLRPGGLSAQSVLHHHRVLREALQQAVKWQFLSKNPADAVVPPRPVRKEMQALDEDQTARLIHAARGSRLYVPIILAVATGLRRGEVLGLRWQDVDLDAGILAVRQALSFTTQGGLVFKAPKTKRSRRTVALPEFVTEVLREHKQEQEQIRQMLGAAYQDLDLVIAYPDGLPWTPNSFTAAFASLLRSYDLPRVRLHDLRHTHASHLLKQGVNPKVVSERLGHSTVTLTLDTYSHLLPGMQEEAAQRVDRALKAALSTNGFSPEDKNAKSS